MGRLAEISTEVMNEDQKKIFAVVRPDYTGVVGGPASAWLRSPDLYERLGWMIGYMRHDSGIPSRLLELVILMTVGEWRSEYPWARHEPLAKKAGLGDEVISAISDGKRPDFKNADEEAVYNFCTELKASHSVGDDTYAAALDHLGEQGLVEIIAVLGLYTTVSMTVNAFEIPDNG